MKQLLIASLLLGFTAAAQSQDLSAEETRTFFATQINMNGLLCARVTDIRPLGDSGNHIEVSCVKYRKGTGTAVYILDPKTKKAVPE